MYEKKITIRNITIALLIVIGTINAKENVDFSWHPTNIGFGFNFSDNRNNTELFMELFNFFLDNNKTKIGIKLSPASLRINYDTKETEKTITEMNFLNFGIYRDFLNETDMIFGPFSSIQYINLRNWEKVDYRDITMNAGLKFIYKIDDEDIEKSYGKFVRMGVELGYRYNYYDKHKFFFNFSIDLISIIFMFDKMAGLFQPVEPLPAYKSTF